MHEGIAIERKQIALSSDKVVVFGRAAAEDCLWFSGSIQARADGVR